MHYKSLSFCCLLVGCFAINTPTLAAPDCAALFQQAKIGTPAQVLTQLEGLPAECETLAVALHKANNYVELAKSATDDAGQKHYAALALSQLQAAQAKQPDNQTALIIYGLMAEAQYLQGRRDKTSILLDDSEEFASQHQLPLPPWLSSFKEIFEVALLTEPLTSEEIKQALTERRFVSRKSINIRVSFAYDSDTLKPEGQHQVDKLAQAVADLVKQGQKIMVGGHTDKQGTDDYNQDLSERRALRVCKLLQQNYPEQAALFQSQGFGESRLRYEGDSEQDHALNRRVEVILLD